VGDRERYIYNDLARRTGTIVLSSSRGAEQSYELDELNNGVFTEEILIALTSGAADLDKDGLVSSEELRRHVARGVAARTSDKQHPTVDRDNLDAFLAIPVTGSASGIVGRTDAPIPPDDAALAEATPRSLANAGSGDFAKTRAPAGCGCRTGAVAPVGWGFGAFVVAALALAWRRRG
jgi:MYXO-CTERM domain-containing protein